MKSRIVAELLLLADKPAESNYIADLMAKYHASEQQISDTARRALVDLLFNYSDFNISTIDSFFQVILRTFARDVELVDDFNVEMEDDYVISVGIHNLINSLRVGEDTDNGISQLRSWLLKSIQNKIDEKQGWNVFNIDAGPKNSYSEKLSLKAIANVLKTERFKLQKKEIIDYLSDFSKIKAFQEELSHKISDYESNLRKYASQFNAAVGKINGFDASSNLRDGSESLMQAIGQIGHGDFNINKNFLKKTDISGEIKQRPKISDAVRNDAENQLRPIFDAVQCDLRKLKALKSVRSNIYALGLLGNISKNVEQFRAENEIILLSDTNDLLKRIITEDDAPFIYERIGMMLSNYLIDEFQDTSRMQWENLHPLLSESLSHNNANLIIGDEKQSIYRFRNAEPELLQKDVNSQLGKFVNSSSLDTNYRSSEVVVKFNNAFFSILSQKLTDMQFTTVNDTYQNIVQNVAPSKVGSGGYVRIEQFTKKDDGLSNAQSIKAQMLDRTIEIIHDIIARGYRQRDILVLVDKNDLGTEVIESIMSTQGDEDSPEINVVSNESLLLKNSRAVSTIVGVLRFLDQQVGQISDNEAANSRAGSLAAIMHAYNKRLNNGEGASEALYAAIKEQDANSVDNLKAVFDVNVSSLYVIVETIVREFVPVKLQTDENSFILAFLDLVIDYCQVNLPTISAFLKWWDANGANQSVNSPSDIDAVNVMTVHKAKGLEAKFVIIPFCDWKIVDIKELLLYDKKPLVEEYGFDESITPPVIPMVALGNSRKPDNELYASEFNSCLEKNVIDKLNKTYVAFTRAKDELYILMSASSSKDPKNINDFLSKVVGERMPLHEDAPSLESDGTYFRFGEQLKCNVPKSEEKGTAEMKFTLRSKYFDENGERTGFNKYEFELPDIGDTPRQIGINKHKIMSMLRTADDVELMVRRCAARGFIRNADIEPTIATFKAYMAQEEPSRWFASGVKFIAERPMSDGSQVLRSDRIVFPAPGEAIVVDFKFGERDKRYHSQMKRYIQLLGKCGYTSIIGKIWYPDSSLIETITL
ncbi:MAG: UvrD-helicase domain-containing protein, partial [Muribaculaceae bacterium]